MEYHTLIMWDLLPSYIFRFILFISYSFKIVNSRIRKRAPGFAGLEPCDSHESPVLRLISPVTRGPASKGVCGGHY
jgi:hypothetical protein